METCVDDVLRGPVVPAVTAIEEPVQAAAYAGASVPAEDALSLAGKAAANWPIFKNLPYKPGFKENCCKTINVCFKRLT